MKAELEKLDQLLQEKRPEFYANLNNPLSEDEITALETEYAITLPEDIKELYRWKNGQGTAVYQSLVNGCIFQPLAVVLTINKEFTAMIGNEFYLEDQWNENWLPIFRDGGGSSICYDLKGIFTEQKGQLIHYLQGYDERQVLAPGLEGFIKQLNRYYEETSSKDYDPYFDISDRIAQWKQSFYCEWPIE